MLSDNIKKYRKANNMSQDELAEKLNVSRQSVSLWETGQSQPTLDNIVALARIFGVSSDELLGNAAETKERIIPNEESKVNNGGNSKKIIGILTAVIAVLAIALIVVLFSSHDRNGENREVASVAVVDVKETVGETTEIRESETVVINSSEQETAEPETVSESPAEQESTEEETQEEDTPEAKEIVESSADHDLAETQEVTLTQAAEDFDLFHYCKEFAIQKGNLNGDYCMYQQPSTLYGGYEDEYFSISYWGDSDMVEFCLHCPLSETYSINFYLRMRGGYDGKYEYLTSRYYRSDGVPVRSATGYIDPSVFSDKYPLSCDSYTGSTDGQSEFMEESRVGMCDLIKCLKRFVAVENMDCSFSDFDFVNF